MTVDDFIRAFRYKSDGWLDTWRIIDDTQEGDCDDFAVTVSYLESGSLFKMWLNIVLLRHRFYWCKSPTGVNHMILKTPDGWIDNIFPAYRPKPEGHKWVIYYPWPFAVFKLILGKVFR
jgi:hypothetical protein